MKKIVIIASIFLAGVTSVQAQTKDKKAKTKSNKEIAASKSQAMKADLKLTDEQTQQLNEAMLKRMNTTSSNEKIIELAEKNIKASKNSYQSEMKSILTEKQLQQYQAKKKETK